MLQRGPNCVHGLSNGAEQQAHDSAERAHGQRQAEATIAAQRRTASQNSGRFGDRAQRAEDAGQVRGQGGREGPDKLKLDAMPAPLINQEPVLKQYDFVKLDNDLLVVDPMDSTIVAVIPRKFPKEQATQGSAPSGQTHDPASKGDEAETSKKS